MCTNPHLLNLSRGKAYSKWPEGKALHQSPPPGTSLAVQWLRRCTSTAGGTGSIPGRGTKILQATWLKSKQNKKKPTTMLEKGNPHYSFVEHFLPEAGKDSGHAKHIHHLSYMVLFSTENIKLFSSGFCKRIISRDIVYL